MFKLIIYLIAGVVMAVLGSLLAALVFGEGRKLRKESTGYSGLTKLVLFCALFLLALIVVSLLLSYWVSLWFLLALLPVAILSLGIGLLADPNDPSVGSKNRVVTKEEYLAIKARFRDQ
jgi:hypothetical protein